MKINNRWFNNFFSQNILLLIISIVLYSFSFTPWAEVEVKLAVNQNLISTSRYLAMLSLITGFRGNIPVLKALHKTVAILLALVPTVFLLLTSVATFFIMIMNAVMATLAGEITSENLISIFSTFPFFFLALLTTVTVWLIVIRVIFKQYQYPYDLDAESKFASVAFLLFLFGPLGIHRFFVKRLKGGFLFLVTFGFLGFGVLYDAVLLTLGRFQDSDGNEI